MDKEKIGVNTGSFVNLSFEESLILAKKMNFRTVEIMLFEGDLQTYGEIPGIKLKKSLPSNQKDSLLASLAPFKHLSCHAPFFNTPLFVCNKGIRKEVIKQMKESIDTAAFINSSTVTLHANEKSPFIEKKKLFAEMVDTFKYLGDYAAKKNVKIGLETGFYPRSVDEYIDLVNTINHPYVGSTLDVGHMFYYIDSDKRVTASGQKLFIKFLQMITENLAEKIFNIHVHNIREADWVDHRSISEGFIDFKWFFRLLKQIEYNYLLILEFSGTLEDTKIWSLDSKRILEHLTRTYGTVKPSMKSELTEK